MVEAGRARKRGARLESNDVRIRLLGFARLLIGAVVLCGLGAAAVWFLYGGGGPHPDLAQDVRGGPAVLTAAYTHDQPFGNIAFSRDGRMFFTVHPEARTGGPGVFEWTREGPKPFPGPDLQASLFVTPLGLAADANNRLWVIDHGRHGLKQARLIAIDIATGRIARTHILDRRVAPRGSLVQDLQISPDGAWIYLADASFVRRDPAIIVFDVERGHARRTLAGHPSVQPRRKVIRTPDRTMRLAGGLIDLRLGVDGLALNADGSLLYYGAMNAGALYEVETVHLRAIDAAPETVAASVRLVAEIPLSGGKTRAPDGRVLVTDVEHGAIVRVSPDGVRETLVRDRRIRWADTVVMGPDDALYIADSALPAYALRPPEAVQEGAPYHVWRFGPPVPDP